MKKILFCLLLTGMFLSLMAEYLPLSQETGNTFTVTDSKSSYTDISFKLNGIDITTENYLGKEYSHLRHPEAGYLLEAGKPELPIFSTTIAIPNGCEYDIEIVNEDTRLLKNILPYPSKGSAIDPQLRNFTIDNNYYSSHNIYPIEAVKISEASVFRDFRIVTLTVQPLSFNPDKNELNIRTNVSIRVNYRGSLGSYTISNRKLSRSFEPLYRSQILNFDQIRDEMPQYQNRSLLIIHPNSTQITSILQQFADWKHQKGFIVNTASTQVTGTTTTAIKTYIANAYNTWENPPEYVILIGDASGSIMIPTYNGYQTTYGEGDYPYTLITEGDSFGDLFIGRISVSTAAQFSTVWAKIKLSEMTPNMTGDTSWYENTVLVGDPSHSGQSTIDTSHYIKEMMLDYNSNYTFSEIYDNGPNPSDITNAINEGCTIYNYRGYLGMSGWSPSSLNNPMRMPNAVIITCGTGSFENSDSATEVLLRSGTTTAPKGALSAIGMATTGTHTAFNNCLNGGIFHGIFRNKMRDMGQALLNGKVLIAKTYGITNPSQAQNFNHWCNLMGDPSMEINLTIPQPLTVNYPEQVALGNNQITVQVLDSLHIPVTDAWVTISSLGDSVFATGYTDPSGYISLTYNPAQTGQINLVVTKNGFIPSINTIAVNTAGSVGLVGYTIDDDSHGESNGNADSIPNSGETIELSVSLKNYMNSIAGEVTASLSSTDPYISITDTLETFGSIDPGLIVPSLDDFNILISPNCPNQHIARFNLVIMSGESVWNNTLEMTISGVDLDVLSYQILDSGNNILEPGETTQFRITLQNNGMVPLENISATIICPNGNFEITDSLATFGNILLGEAISCNENWFELRALPHLVPGMTVPLEITIFNENYSETETINIPIGTPSLTTPLGPDSYGYVCYDDGDADYPDRPDYQWIEIAPSAGGSGISTGINDPGENQDITMSMDMPFTFLFYGQVYNRISICSNGWISFGDTEIHDFRNWPIPGPMGPSPMIAAFWDDLVTTGGGVYTYYDAANHIFIIEWNNMKNAFNTQLAETFQIILYDPSFYATSMGDSPIKIQYQIVNNVDSQSGTEHGNFATVGIEDHTGLVGLQYTDQNIYPLTSKPLQNEMAILFTTVPVLQNQANLILGAPIVHDANNNQFLESGELVNLGITLNNLGTVAAENPFVTIATSDPFVSIICDTSSYHTVEGSASGVNINYFQIQVAQNCPTPHTILLNVHVESQESAWDRMLSLTVVSSSLTFDKTYVNDRLGNLDGLADPGETITYIVNLKNQGLIPTAPGNANLSSTSPLLSITTPHVSYQSVPADNTLQLCFDVAISATATPGTILPLQLTLDDTQNYAVSLGIQTNGFATDFENGNADFSAQPAGSWFFGTTSDPAPYSGSNCWSITQDGDYTDGLQIALLSAPIQIGSNSVLSFYHFYEFENNYDGGNVSVSTDNGASFQLVTPEGGYTHQSVSALQQQPGWSNASNGWVQASLNLSAFANSTVIIKWRMGSDGSVVRRGWLIDDIYISGFVQNVASISGRVYLIDSPSNFEKVYVKANNNIVYTNDQGYYRLFMPSGQYSVTAGEVFHETISQPCNLETSNSYVDSLNFQIHYLNAPTSLVSSIDVPSNSVHLGWSFDAPRQNELARNNSKKSSNSSRMVFLGYNVYRQINAGALQLIATTQQNSYDEVLLPYNNYKYFVTAKYDTGESDSTNNINFFYVPVSEQDSDLEKPVNKLNANYPNPFNPETTIGFSLAKDTKVELTIYNIKGQLVKSLVNNYLTKGTHRVVWNGKDQQGKSVSSGVYFYKIKTREFNSVRKALLIK